MWLGGVFHGGLMVMNIEMMIVVMKAVVVIVPQ